MSTTQCDTLIIMHQCGHVTVTMCLGSNVWSLCTLTTDGLKI